MKSQKQFKAFWAGIMLMAVGGWMIFYNRDNLGFIPAVIGALAILWRQK